MHDNLSINRVSHRDMHAKYRNRKMRMKKSDYDTNRSAYLEQLEGRRGRKADCLDDHSEGVETVGLRKCYMLRSCT
jgi:hypothetical protein